MKSFLVGCAIAACAAPSSPQALDVPPVAVTITRAQPAAPAPRSPYTSELAPNGPATPTFAAHSDTIQALAVTEDGKVAVSVDAHGSLRLWPSLDGKHEPVVLVARPPKNLAIGYTGADLAIAGLDNVGQLELVRTTALGVPVSRVEVGAPRPFVDVRALDDGVLALRDDKVLALFALDGTLVAELSPEPGEPVLALAVRTDRVLAIVGAKGHVRGRWIEHAGSLAWGEATAPLPIDASSTAVALAPDHARIGARQGGKMVIVELARGRAVATPWSDGAGDRTLRPIGFIDDATFAFAANRTLQWWRHGAATSGDTNATDFASVAVDHRLVIGFTTELQLATPDASHFLGYKMQSVADLVHARRGWLASDGRTVVHLDEHGHADRTYELPRASSMAEGWDAIQLVDATHVIAHGTRNSGQSETYLLDLSSKTAPLAIADGAAAFAYQRSTHVLAFHNNGGILLARFAPERGEVSKVVRMPGSTSWSAQLFLLDGRSSGGTLAVLVDVSSQVTSSQVTITEIQGFDPDLAEPLQTRVHTRALPQGFWDKRDFAALASLDRRRRSPDHAFVATVVDGRLTLRDRAGTIRWTTATAADDVIWTPTGELVAYGGGFAQIDLATGEPIARQCGWTFGLWDAFTGGAGSTALCERSSTDEE